MRGRWDAKSNPRDYGIARNFGSGSRDRKTLLGTLLSRKMVMYAAQCFTYRLSLLMYTITPVSFLKTITIWLL